MVRKAYYIDPYSTGNYHEVINASYLYVISSNYDEVTCITSVSSYENMLKILEQYGCPVNNVKLKHIEVKKYVGKRFKGLKYLLYHKKCSDLDLKCYMETEPATDVFFSNNILLGLNRLNKKVKQKHNRVFIMCHSEMNILEKTGDAMTRPEYVTRFFLQKFLSHSIDSLITVFVLGDRICNRVKKHSILENHKRIKSFDHLYFRIPVKPYVSKPLPGKRPYKIGIPSMINEARGVNKLIELLDSSKKDRGFDVYAIGRVFTNRDLSNVELYQLNTSSHLMSTEQYLGYTKLMDAMIFFIDENNFGASGGMLEAIWNEKMIIAIKNNYNMYLFDKFGPMGVLFDTLGEMIFYLNNHLDDLQNKQCHYMDNLKKAKEALKPENNVIAFADFISRL